MTDYAEFKALCEASKGRDPRAAYTLQLMGEYEKKAERKKAAAPTVEAAPEPKRPTFEPKKTAKRRRKKT